MTPLDAPPAVIVTDRGPGSSLNAVIIKGMTPIAQVGVRATRTYLQALVGFLLAALASAPVMAAVGVVVPPGDFWATLKIAAGLAVAPTVISALQNLIEIFARLDEKFPKTRA